MATKKNLEENVIEETKAERDPYERVEIMIPYVDGEDPIHKVGVNGVYTQIRKGEFVEVPRYVAEVVQRGNKMAIEARKNRQKFKKQSMDL